MLVGLTPFDPPYWSVHPKTRPLSLFTGASLRTNALRVGARPGHPNPQRLWGSPPWPPALWVGVLFAEVQILGDPRSILSKCVREQAVSPSGLRQVEVFEADVEQVDVPGQFNIVHDVGFDDLPG